MLFGYTWNWGNGNNQVFVSTTLDSLYRPTQGRWDWQHDSILVILWLIFFTHSIIFSQRNWTSFLGEFLFVHQRLGCHRSGHMIWQFHLVLCEKVSCRQPISNKTQKILTFITVHCIIYSFHVHIRAESTVPTGACHATGFLPPSSNGSCGITKTWGVSWKSSGFRF